MATKFAEAVSSTAAAIPAPTPIVELGEGAQSALVRLQLLTGKTVEQLLAEALGLVQVYEEITLKGGKLLTFQGGTYKQLRF